MIRLLTAVFLFASFNAVAEVTLTELNNNTPADADEVMGNFNALKNEIESLPTPPTDCTTNQIIKWDGSAWVCASRVRVWNPCGENESMCDALCAEGTTVVSGGCDFRPWGGSGTVESQWSVPLSDGSGWSCGVFYSGSASYSEAYAICQ